MLYASLWKRENNSVLHTACVKVFLCCMHPFGKERLVAEFNTKLLFSHCSHADTQAKECARTMNILNM